MAISTTNLSRNGLRDWLIQRFSAIIMTAYAVYLFVYFLNNSPVNYIKWHLLFSTEWFRFFTLLTLISLMLHAWVGIWTVFTDYIKCAKLRLILQTLVIIALLGCMVWGIQILWSI
jgi:succinate dehydrogenase / fumarate reductase membrane anchor subunit